MYLFINKEAVVEHSALAAELAAVTHESAAHARTLRDSAGKSVSVKGTDDFVSNADREVEALICKRVASLSPHAETLAEERGGIKRATFAAHPLVFVIDPIDGTTNYLRNQGPSATMVGAYSFGEQIAGSITDIGSGVTYRFWRGGGVWQGDQKLEATEKPEDFSPQKALIACEWTGGARPRDSLELIWPKLMDRVGVRMMGCAGNDCLGLAKGGYDGIVHNGFQPHDWTGLLMLEELGIRVHNWGKPGEPVDIFDPTIIAAPPWFFEELHDLIWG